MDATVRKPAEAEQYKVRTLADARKYQLQTEAAGEAEAIRARGEGEASAAKAKGLANAEVIKEQGLAEAEATYKKAQAWEQYTQAAIIQQVIDALPEIAGAISAPLSKTERIVVISGGEGNDSGAGTSRITRDVTNIVAQVPATIEALTGVNLMDALGNLRGIKQTGDNDSKAEKSDDKSEE